MKRSLTYIGSFFILLLLLISSRFVFFMSYVSSQKTEFRKQLIEQKSSDTKVLKFTHKELFQNGNGYEWKEKNKELVIHGVYHEVLCVQSTPDFVLVTVVEDKSENELFKCYFNMNHQRQNPLKELAFSLLGLNFIMNHTEIAPYQFSEKVDHPKYLSLSVKSSFFMRLLKPPGLV